MKVTVSAATNDRIKKIDSSRKGRILKSIKEIEKLINAQGNGVWPNNAVTMLERNLFEAIRILEKGVNATATQRRFPPRSFWFFRFGIGLPRVHNCVRTLLIFRTATISSCSKNLMAS